MLHDYSKLQRRKKRGRRSAHAQSLAQHSRTQHNNGGGNFYHFAYGFKNGGPKAARWRWHGALLFMASALLTLLLMEASKSEASIKQQTDKPSIPEIQASPEHDTAIMESYDIALPPLLGVIPAAEISSNEIAEDQWRRFKVKPGDNLAIIIVRAGIRPGELHELMRLGKPVAVLKTLYPDDEIRVQALPDGRLAALEYDVHQSKRLRVIRLDQSALGADTGKPVFKAQTITRPLDIQHKHTSEVIQDSLFLAARRAGLTDKKAIELADIFAWDIDFALEVRKGDRFTVVYEQHYREGEYIADGPIMAAEFINQGKVYRALRYTDPTGHTDYYSPDGGSLRKTFLRNPVAFSRISSYFNLKRKHPILNKIRAHKGVDYAAKTGTPIRAAGDGKIIFRGKKGGYGRTIIIQHGQRYSTLYAHMSRYARNIAVGRIVKQEQVIGYVGQSGLATGPHLHYEFRVDGVHRNPLTVKHPSVEPVPDQYRRDFLAKTTSLVAQLDTLKRLQLAVEQHEPQRQSL